MNEAAYAETLLQPFSDIRDELRVIANELGDLNENITASIDGRHILFKTLGYDWTVCPSIELGGIISAAVALLEYGRKAA